MRILETCFLIAILLPAYGQENVKTFYTKNGVEGDSASSYYYSLGTKSIVPMGIARYVDTVYSYFTDGGQLKSRIFYDEKGLYSGAYEAYFKNGQLQEKGFYKESRHRDLTEGWYENGQLHYRIYFPETEDPVQQGQWESPYEILDYWDSLGTQLVKNKNGYCHCQFPDQHKESGEVKDGLRDSEWTGYSGDTLLYKETYDKGKLLKGISYKDSQLYPYDKLAELPEFRGGWEAMMNFIRSNMTYPKEARRKGWAGTVFVQFG